MTPRPGGTGHTSGGAGVHHNPAPGPAGSPFVYGHVWVVLGLLAAHPAWGVIALPLLARLYVRAKDLAQIIQPLRRKAAAPGHPARLPQNCGQDRPRRHTAPLPP